MIFLKNLVAEIQFTIKLFRKYKERKKRILSHTFYKGIFLLKLWTGTCFGRLASSFEKL